MDRNGRPEWSGMGGRNQSESVAGMRRNTHLALVGLSLVVLFALVMGILIDWVGGKQIEADYK